MPLVSCHARLIWLDDVATPVRPAGAIGDTAMPAPDTNRLAPPVPLKATLPLNIATESGLKRTVTDWLWPVDKE